MKENWLQINLWLILLAVILAVIPFQGARADSGPHPSMQFTFASQVKPAPTILFGQLLLCKEADCVQPEPLQQVGPQRFKCQAASCHALTYSVSPYYLLEIEFSDGITRQSNIFTKRAFATNYLVTILADSLEVEEKPVGANVPFFKSGAPTLTDLLATLTFPIMEIILPVILLVLAVRSGRAGATQASYYNWLKAAWLLAIPATLAGIKWTQGLLITLAVELLLGAGYAIWKKRSMPLILTVILLLNLITQPALWVTLSGFSGISPLQLIIFAEAAVWLVEAGALYLAQRNSMKFQEALWLSLALNAASFVAGLLLPV
jgi:hypothetical protein